jgi:hypothetical protein
MIITRRACLFALGAMLSLPLWHNARAADPTPKAAISGLVSRGEPSNTLDPLNAQAKQGVFFGGLVIQATWSQLQPNGQNTPIVTTSIDQALTLVMRYNHANSTHPLAVRLRVFSGCSAPDWAMTLGGVGPFNIVSTDPSTPSCFFGPFWSNDTSVPYRQAWANLVQQIADKYESHPLIHEVAVTSCSTATAEPFVFPAGDIPDKDKSAMIAAGYTDAKHRDCLAHAVDDYAGWKTSRLTFPFSSFRGLTQAADAAFTGKVMRDCRQAVGRRCVLDNHGLDSVLAAHILPIYALIRKMGPVIAFQSLYDCEVAGPNCAQKDPEGTISKGISLGAGSIELYQQPKGFPAVPAPTLKQWAAMFQPQ